MTIAFLVSCDSKKQGDQESDLNKKNIAVVNYPLYYFAKTIGGPHVQVYFPAIEGDPAYWSPSTKQVHHFQQAELILTNGAGYEKWMEKVSLPSSKVVVTAGSFKDQWIRIRETVTHSHGPEGEHVHEGTAFTTWLDFKLALRQAEAVHESVKRILPGHEDEIDQNYQDLKRELEALDQLAIKVATQIEDGVLLDAHGIFQYFASGYGLKYLSDHLEAGEMPSDTQWLKLEETVQSHRISVMLWEETPIGGIRNRLDKMNVKIAIFNPCANRPEEGSFIDIMEQNLMVLESALSKK